MYKVAQHSLLIDIYRNWCESCTLLVVHSEPMLLNVIYFNYNFHYLFFLQDPCAEGEIQEEKVLHRAETHSGKI